MAKTAYQLVPSGDEENFLAGLKSGDRFYYSKTVRNDSLVSRKRKKGLSQKTLLPQVAAIWATFTEAEKLAWFNAGAMTNLTGWRLFVQDQCIRIFNEMSGSAVPVLTHQSWVGNLKLAGSADEIKIAQYHPHNYWVSRKIYGKKSMYEPVLVPEDVGLPLEIGLSYKSELVVASTPNFAKFYAEIWHSYQSVDLYTKLEIPLDYFSDWKIVTALLSTIKGYIVDYNLFFHLKGLTGNLYFDNIKATHSVHNWARDPQCKQIAVGFTRAFYQIPKNWVAQTLPDGAEYDSIYKDF